MKNDTATIYEVTFDESGRARRTTGPAESTLATLGRYLDALRWLVAEWAKVIVDVVVWRGWG